jgi:hypothetical protein
MATRPRVNSDLTFTIPANTATVKFPRVGRAYHCISVSVEGVVRIGLDYEPEAGEFLRTAMGRLLPPEDSFENIQLLNTHGAPVTVVLSTDVGTIIDNRLMLAGGAMPVSITGTPSVQPVPGNTFTASANQTISTAAHFDIAADTTRRELFVTNTHATNTIFARDASGTTAIGLPIGPGATVILETTAAVRLRNESGANVTVNIAQVNQV